VFGNGRVIGDGDIDSPDHETGESPEEHGGEEVVIEVEQCGEFGGFKGGLLL
jgi:hypothetical protein